MFPSNAGSAFDDRGNGDLTGRSFPTDAAATRIKTPETGPGLIAGYISSRTRIGRLNTPNSQNTYRRVLGHFCKYLAEQGTQRETALPENIKNTADSDILNDRLLLNATRQDVEGYLAQFSNVSTHNLKAVVLKNFFKFLVQKGCISENPVQVETKKSGARDLSERFLNTEERDKLLRRPSYDENVQVSIVRSIMLAQLVFMTGQKASVLAGLKIEQIGVKGDNSVTISIPKGNLETRRVSFTGTVATRFREYLDWRRQFLRSTVGGEQCKSVFFNSKTLEPIGHRGMRRGLTKALSSLGLSTEISFGDIRLSGLKEIIERHEGRNKASKRQEPGQNGSTAKLAIPEELQEFLQDFGFHPETIKGVYSAIEKNSSARRT